MNEGSSSSSSLPYEIVKKEGQEQEKTGGKIMASANKKRIAEMLRITASRHKECY